MAPVVWSPIVCSWFERPSPRSRLCDSPYIAARACYRAELRSLLAPCRGSTSESCAACETLTAPAVHTRLCLWESSATVPDIARPDTTLIASRIWGIKMIFLLQPNLTPLRVVGGRLRPARALVSLFLGRLRGASGGRAVR